MRSDKQFNSAEQSVERELLRYYAEGNPAPAFVERLQQQLRAQATGTGTQNAEPDRSSGFWERWLTAPRGMRGVTVAATVLLVLAVTIGALGPQRVWAQMQRLLGYVPGVGFVDLAETRVLVAQVEATRDGVTVRVEQVIAAKDRTRLVLRSDGLPLEETLLPAGARLTSEDLDFAGSLILPDGTPLKPKTFSLRWGAGTLEFPPLPADVFAATLELDRLPLLPAGATPENWRIGLVLQHATGPLIATLFPQPYQPTGASDTHHGITVSVVDVAHTAGETVLKLRGTWENRDWEIRSLDGGMYLPALRDDAGHVYGWAPSSDSGSVVVREVVSVPQPTAGPTPISEPAALERVIALAPLSVLAHDLTLEIEGIEAEVPTSGNFRITIPDGAQVGAAWPLDIQLTVAGFPVHITGARLYEETIRVHDGDLRRRILGFDVAPVPYQDGITLAMFWIDSPSPAWHSGPGSSNLGQGHIGVSLALESGAALSSGAFEVEIKGASIVLHGPWRMKWEVPGKSWDATTPVSLHPSAATDQHDGLTLQVIEAVHTDRLTQLRLDLQGPPPGVRLNMLQLWDTATQRTGLRFEDDRAGRYDSQRPNTSWRRPDEATLLTGRQEAGPQILVLPPVDPLANRLTVTIPAIEVVRPGGGSFEVSVPEGVELKEQADGRPRSSDPWPVDISVAAGGYEVRYTHAQLMDNRGAIWLVLANAEEAGATSVTRVSGLCSVRATAPSGRGAVSGALDTGVCSPVPNFSVQDTSGRLEAGTYRVTFDGIAVVVPGPWRLSWETKSP